MSKRCREYVRDHPDMRLLAPCGLKPAPTREASCGRGPTLSRCPSLRLEPSRDRRDHMLLFSDRERSPRFNPVPLRQTPAAARGRRVLGDEHWVPTKWSLLAIVLRCCGREPLGDEVSRVIEHCRVSLGGEIHAFFRLKREAATEPRLSQRGKEGIEISHAESARGARSFRMGG